MLGFIVTAVAFYLIGKNQEKIKEFVGEVLTDNENKE